MLAPVIGTPYRITSPERKQPDNLARWSPGSVQPPRPGNLRLWLCRVIPQGHTVALDLVEALFTEVIPVGNKAIFGWTAASTHSSSTGKPAHRWQNAEWTEHTEATTKDGAWADGRTHTHTYTHRQRYMLVTFEMVMIQSLSFKLEQKLGKHAKMLC